MSKTKIYKIWCSMKARCADKNEVNYGARGISVCQAWSDSFLIFYNWAMENGYQEGLSIERLNNDLSYCPENCKWIPVEDQGKNTRRIVRFSAFNEVKTLTEWSKDYRCVVSYDLLQERLKNGMTPEKALSKLNQNKNGYKKND